MTKSTDPALYVQASKSRLKQAARTGGRKLFDARRRAIFLEWFAATCNAKLAAEKADIGYHTVFRHRRLDSGFAEAWDAALAQGYAVLEAGLLADALASEANNHSNSETDEQATEIISPLNFEQRMALLREYRRADGRRGPRGVGKPPTIAPRIATAEEMEEALIKRLKHFAMRVAEADAGGRPLLGGMAGSPESGIPITGSGEQDSK
jgi:hypothetical protein